MGKLTGYFVFHVISKRVCGGIFENVQKHSVNNYRYSTSFHVSPTFFNL